MSFWENSTDEQKLAQIDGGIECNMTIRQIAMNCGTTKASIAYFGRKHSRSFPAKYSDSAAQKRGASIRAILSARNAGSPNILMQDAFSIFGIGRERDEVIFDAL